MRPPKLSDYGLEGLFTGEPVRLYHGTTADFSEFDISKSRSDLVDGFYGGGLFFTPSKKVAWKYAEANRNMGLPVSVIDDLKRVNMGAALFLRSLYENGKDGWESYWKRHGFLRKKPLPGGGLLDSDGFRRSLGGADPNTLMDISMHIIGTSYREVGRTPTIDDIFNALSQTTGSPDWLYDSLDEVGLDSKKYRPKVLTVDVRAVNPLITDDQEAARIAGARGYDSVFYYGKDTVDGVPEVAVYNGDNVSIVRVDL